MSESLCYDGYNQSAHTEVSMTLRSANGGGERNDACPKVAYGFSHSNSNTSMQTKPKKECAMTLRSAVTGEGATIQTLGFKYKQSEKSQKPFAENGEAQALSSGCHDSAVALGFKAGQSANGGLGDEREVSPTLSHQPSALEPTVAITTLLAAMRYIVRRLTPTECERLMGLPDGYTIPTGLLRYAHSIDGQTVFDPAVVAEFQRIFDTFNAIMFDYAHAKWERNGRKGKEPKPPKPKSAKQVADWLKKISDPATCPDSPRYKGDGNGWATNQPRWILLRLLATDGIDPFNT